MQHQNSVFHGLLKHVPWGRFDRLVDEHDADRRVRTLSTKSQFLSLLYGQLAGAVSLREIEGGLRSNAVRMYHLGGAPPRRSTLADANAQRPAQVFAALLGILTKQAHRGLRKSIAETAYLIDATSVRLSRQSADWAMFSHHATGGKLHIVYDPAAGQPIYAAVTAANVNDITAAKAMPVEAGATYVFDLGYYDFAFWESLNAAGCRIVTRLKTNTRLDIVSTNATPEGSAILSDRIGHLPRRMAKSRTNPLQDRLREICVRIDGGKVLRILTNDLGASASEIADLYKRRWQIELFFRWIKQTLKIRHFLGHSENAVRIQIAIALIAFLLLRIAHAAQSAVHSLLAFTRLVRVNLMQRRTLGQLLDPPPPLIEDRRQMALSL